jgi:ubiquinone/menaquinone biosynthesis C-methylase UbiE
MAAVNGNPMKRAYAGAGTRWLLDAELAYAPMARHLVDNNPGSWTGSRVLDAGAGTGAAGAVLDRAGATVVAVDLETSMLSAGLRRRRLSVAGDVTVLPFGNVAFDAVVAAFVLNHLADPASGLREFARVTRPGGLVLASVFSTDRSQAKVVIEQQLRSFGWQPPDWYTIVQAHAEQTATREAMRAVAVSAGLSDIDVRAVAVDVDLDAERIVQYRLGIPHNARFVDRLDDDHRAELVRTAVAAIVELDEPFRPDVIELVARVS